MLDTLRECCEDASHGDEVDELVEINALDLAYGAKPRLSGLALALPVTSMAEQCLPSTADSEAANNIFGNAWPGIAVAYC
jgi:hypothetical protein